MKKFYFILAICMVMFVACNKEEQKQEESVQTTTQQEEVYVPTSDATTVDMAVAKKYNYFSAPKDIAATDASILYEKRQILVKYLYPNGDTYTYVVPNFTLWKNQSGKMRVLKDENNTVWIQGSDNRGKFHEFVFVGDPQFNGQKIKPNSYTGKIKYRK